MNEKKTGIVLEGGGMRGMYTAGVLDVLMEHGIYAGKAVGVSAGALFGVNYYSKQQGRAIRYNKKYNADKSYMGLLPLIREGNMVSTEYAYNRVPTKLDPFDNEAYMQSGYEFYAVITDVETGNPEYVLVKDIFAQMDVLRASGSLPFVSKAVEINERKYLDGAIGDNIPYEWMAGQGVDKLIVVLTQDDSYRKKPMKPVIANIYKHKYPAIAKGLIERADKYNSQVEMLRQWEEQGKAFVIRPSVPVKIGRIERKAENLEAVYRLGVKDAEACLEALKKYLES